MSSKLKVAVVLSGSGVFDGSEIHEAVSILVALDKLGAAYECLAPDVPQRHVIDHLKGVEDPAPRNVLTESARIARGKVRAIASARAADFDAVVLPGGFGAAKNLSSFAFDGAGCTVEPATAAFLSAAHAAGKPIGLACIAPVIAAKLFGADVTIGTDKATADAIRAMGARHTDTDPTGVHVDAKHKVVTTPCYMNDVGPWTVFQGAEKMVAEVLRLAKR